jgi:hypothetical protein
MKKRISFFAIVTVVLYANHVVVDHALIDHCHMMSDHRASHPNTDSSHASCHGHGAEDPSQAHNHRSDEHRGHCHLQHSLMARTGGGGAAAGDVLPVVVFQKDLNVPQCAAAPVSRLLRSEEAARPDKPDPLVYRSLLL